MDIENDEMSVAELEDYIKRQFKLSLDSLKGRKLDSSTKSELVRVTTKALDYLGVGEQFDVFVEVDPVDSNKANILITQNYRTVTINIQE